MRAQPGRDNQPPDQFPSLKFNSQNIPHIAYHHIVGQTDTIKLAYWSDSLNGWWIEHVYEHSYGCAPVDLDIDNQDIPYVAHGVDIGLYCSWRINGTWYHEYTGMDIGWLGVRLSLTLGSDSSPHIFYHPVGPVKYCYKDTIWHDCGRLDSTQDNMGNINLSLTRIGQACVSFRFSAWDSVAQTDYHGIKYARGTFVGIEEDNTGRRMQDVRCRLRVFASVSSGFLHIKYALTAEGGAEMAIYDVCGVRIESIKQKNFLPGNYQKTLNLNDLASGIYFVVLKQNNEQVSKKFLLIK